MRSRRVARRSLVLLSLFLLGPLCPLSCLPEPLLLSVGENGLHGGNHSLLEPVELLQVVRPLLRDALPCSPQHFVAAVQTLLVRQGLPGSLLPLIREQGLQILDVPCPEFLCALLLRLANFHLPLEGIDLPLEARNLELQIARRTPLPPCLLEGVGEVLVQGLDGPLSAVCLPLPHLSHVLQISAELGHGDILAVSLSLDNVERLSELPRLSIRHVAELLSHLVRLVAQFLLKNHRGSGSLALGLSGLRLGTHLLSLSLARPRLRSLQPPHELGSDRLKVVLNVFPSLLHLPCPILYALIE
mmetsp:Transcript_11232/g.22982  ORF Transcript_11232/g.22982 Transcript_11232/m.22982 type:complete len:301 (+) Transcript_11232:50-952(+)